MLAPLGCEGDVRVRWQVPTTLLLPVVDRDSDEGDCDDDEAKADWADVALVAWEMRCFLPVGGYATDAVSNVRLLRGELQAVNEDGGEGEACIESEERGEITFDSNLLLETGAVDDNWCALLLLSKLLPFDEVPLLFNVDVVVETVGAEELIALDDDWFGVETSDDDPVDESGYRLRTISRSSLE